MLQKLPKNKKEFTWPDFCDTAFKDAKAKLANATMLIHPDVNAELPIFTDASTSSVGAVLQQRFGKDDPWQTLSFFSRKLNPTQSRYSAFDREFLAFYLTIKQFMCYVEGRNFSIYTDHKPLTTALLSKTE